MVRAEVELEARSVRADSRCRFGAGCSTSAVAASHSASAAAQAASAAAHSASTSTAAISCQRRLRASLSSCSSPTRPHRDQDLLWLPSYSYLGMALLCHSGLQEHSSLFTNQPNMNMRFGIRYLGTTAVVRLGGAGGAVPPRPVRFEVDLFCGFSSPMQQPCRPPRGAGEPRGHETAVSRGHRGTVCRCPLSLDNGCFVLVLRLRARRHHPAASRRHANAAIPPPNFLRRNIRQFLRRRAHEASCAPSDGAATIGA